MITRSTPPEPATVFGADLAPRMEPWQAAGPGARRRAHHDEQQAATPFTICGEDVLAALNPLEALLQGEAMIPAADALGGSK